MKRKPGKLALNDYGIFNRTREPRSSTINIGRT
jgi:hypothetical protein